MTETSMTRTGFAILVVLASGISACGDGQSGPDITLDLSTMVNDTGSLPDLDPAFNIEETRTLREGFSWGDFERVPERDAEARHTLHYVILYIDRIWQRDFLRSVGLHTSFVPLFEEERERWAGQAGFFTLEGDREGVFMFAIVPGFFLNGLKDIADGGEPPFAAVIKREPPTPDAVTSDGFVSYEYLADEGFLYGGTALPAGVASNAEEALARAAPKLGPTPIVMLRALVSPIEDFVDEARGFFGLFDRAAAGSAEITVLVLPFNTDPSFSQGTPIVRGWGNDLNADKPWVPTRGEPLWFRDVTVQSHKGASLFRGNAGREGRATFQVAKGQQNLCVELANPAAEITNFLTALVLCNFNDPEMPDLNLDIQEDADIVMTVQDYRVNFFAQAQDSYDYLTWVVGRSPRQARIITGFFADAVGEIQGISDPSNRGRAFAPCLGNSLDASAFLLQLTPILGVGLPLDVDIVMPFDQNPSANSRGVLTHEYGHFALCDLMHQINAHKFNESWVNVTSNVLGGPGGSNEIAYMNEAFADFFALQVVGGTNYPSLNGAISVPVVPGGAPPPLTFCPVEPDPNARDCAEDNVGGLTQGITNSLGNYQYNIARAVSLFHDAFDGTAPMPEGLYPTNPGAAWEFVPSINTFVWSDRTRTNAQDESVALPGSAMIDFVRNLFDHVSTLDERNFHNALARTALQYGHTEEQVCEMFSLHAGAPGVPGLAGVAQYNDCRDMIDPDALSFGSIVPSAPTDVRIIRDPSDPQAVEFRWNDLSPIADRYDVELTGGAGALSDMVPYNRTANYTASGLGSDTEYRFTVTTVNGESDSSSSANFVTFAFPPTSVSAAPGPGSAMVSWTVPESASSYEVWILQPEERLLFTTTATSAEVPGLSDAVDYQFGVASRNQIGEPSARVASPFVRPATPTIVYVAPDGDDTAPGAGSQAEPYQSIAAAVQAAESGDMDALWLLEGTYTETEPVQVTEGLDIIGGFRRDTGEWLPGGRSEVIGTSLVAAGVAPTTRLFNGGARSAEIVVWVRLGASLFTSHIDWRLESALDNSACRGVFLVDGALTMEQSTVKVAPTGTGIGSCSAGMMVTLGVALVTQSTVIGVGEIANLPIAMDAAGVAGELSQLNLVDSTFIGYEGTSINSTGTNADLTGVTGDGLTSFRASRITASAMTPAGAIIPSGQLAGLDALVRDAAVIDNSVFRTPSTATHNVALDIGQAPFVGPPAVTLAHVTAAAGSDTGMMLGAVAGSPRAGVRLTGAFSQLLMVNSVVSYAAGARDNMDTTWSGLDLGGITSPFDFVLARGNVISVPLLDGNPSAFPSANTALIYCASDEFSVALTEAQLNDTAIYACNDAGADTASWIISDNGALRQRPTVSSVDLPADPHAIAFDAAGRPIRFFNQLVSSLAKVENAGVDLSSVTSSTISAPQDRGGADRDDNNVMGAGAWIVP